MNQIRKFVALAALSLAGGALGCHDDELFTPASLQPVDPLFARVVSVGNSLTAGFQSAGINDSTQAQSYAVLLAQQMQTPFFVPYMNRPGCPPPLVNVFTGAVVGGVAAPPCALRKTQPVPPPYINNVAVPGAAVEDFVSNFAPGSNANGLTSFFLGGLTQEQMVLKVNPTFVTIFLGNNDVLAAATDPVNAGNPALITPPAIFKARYDSMLGVIAQTPANGKGVLIGVVDVAQIPYLSYGSVYFGAKLQGKLPAKMVVLPNCAPRAFAGVGDTTLVPFRYGFGLIGRAQAGVVDTLDCANDHNITPSELANLHATVVAYNAGIAADTALGYTFLNPNGLLALLKADTSQITIFPHVPPDSAAVTRPFGKAVTRDGVHPSAATHKLLANVLIQMINAKYNTKLAPIP